ncbi:MAG: FtsX-like permease family protein [Desulfobacterales bacterium]
MHLRRGSRLSAALLLAGLLVPAAAAGADFADWLRTLAAFDDRTTGTRGAERAAEFLRRELEGLGLGPVHTHRFHVPVLEARGATLRLPSRAEPLPLGVFAGNAVTPPAMPEGDGLREVVYVGDGDPARMAGRRVEGAILLMELDSGRNWILAADLGARALIYVDRGDSPRTLFEEKFELSPVDFPRFWAPLETLRAAFGDFEQAPEGRLGAAELRAEAAWRRASGENLYCLVRGSAPERRRELLVVEAFYDGTAWISGRAPGADEAVGAATLLAFARHLKEHPPARSVLLLATSGHAQAHAGLREWIAGFSARARDLREARSEMSRRVETTQRTLRGLERLLAGGPGALFAESLEDEEGDLVRGALQERLKTDADRLSRRLMTLRLASGGRDPQELRRLTAERQILRRLTWRTSFAELSSEEERLLRTAAGEALRDQQAVLEDARAQREVLESAVRMRSLLQEFEIAAAVSLHLSSRGDGVGAFHTGGLYPLRPRIHRTPAYSRIDRILQQAAAGAAEASGIPGFLKDSLRPSRRKSWQSFLPDRPALGGEVGALAGMLGLTLATTHDVRPFWGTPADTIARVDLDYARRQAEGVCALLAALAAAPALHEGESLRNGFSSVSGRARFLRHGELFADQPAPGTVLLCYQGASRFYAWVDTRGRFRLNGVADKTHSLHKVVIEAYRFEEASGRLLWAIDKKATGKESYRVRMNRRQMETDLVLFAGDGVSLYRLLEPRSFRHLTRAEVIDGRREAEPLRWFMSRLDTWSSTISTVFLEPGTPVKMTLSDTPLRRKGVLLNADPEHPSGIGYEPETCPQLHRTAYRVARDLWTLLEPRIADLEACGIVNERIRGLQAAGRAALQDAEAALAEKGYGRFLEDALRAWALATRVYDDVDRTQKDVLYGVLFYIALFVPFAFCLERLLFACVNIYRRILAFLAILVALIAVIYQVHPAFRLAYSPLVVILAFLIVGLAVAVSGILYARFEREMAELQIRARVLKSAEIGRWKAFTAAFLLGVSNLRRRPLRTALTCTTLVILTFTLMSFTAVKSVRRHARILYQPDPPYQGMLLRNPNWRSLPAEAAGEIARAFPAGAETAPRAWIEEEDPTRSAVVPLAVGARRAEAQGVMGLSAAEARVTGADRALVAGRWFREDERQAVLLPERLAAALAIDPRRLEEARVRIWGMDFTVAGIFSGEAFEQRLDLDGEPLSPVYFVQEQAAEIGEEELEALESGDDVRELQSRYQHVAAEAVIVLPYPWVMAAGGSLKAVAVRRPEAASAREAAEALVDRFGLSLYSGEPTGTYLYYASDTISYSGVPNLFVPIAISVFIVLNTMIGAVYERKREIAVYTSVGLAPSHVAFLFVAEALAFAVLSAVFGYLLAQTSARLFAGSALWSGITVNYSSLAGVGAMALVIAVVLLSVIYPARVASQIAIPDVNRSWTLPPARGHRLELTLPFLLTYREHRSLGGFLYEVFEGHRDVTHGVFSTSHVAVEFACEEAPRSGSPTPSCPESACEEPRCLALQSRVWLAPFDFGIQQRVGVEFRPAPGEPGFLEIRVVLVRETGESNAWYRINKRFLDTVRRQLLIWRSLDDEAKLACERALDRTAAAAAAA